eukprot:Nk52_evm1s2488 gene=Nk52_evmTU1s2488
MTVLQLKRAPSYLACVTCYTVGSYVHHTMAYEDAHEFLPDDSGLRRTLAENYFKYLRHADERVQRAYSSRPDYRSEMARARAISDGPDEMENFGILGEHCLQGVPLFNGSVQALSDPFHILQNVGKRVREVLKGDLNKPGNAEGERLRGRGVHCRPQNFVLGGDSQNKVDRILTEPKSVPSGIVERVKPLFCRSGDYLKGHDCIAFLGPMLQHALRHVPMKARNYRALVRLFAVVQRLRRTYFVNAAHELREYCGGVNEAEHVFSLLHVHHFVTPTLAPPRGYRPL